MRGVRVPLGNGDGSFQSSYIVGGFSLSVAVADFNRHGTWLSSEDPVPIQVRIELGDGTDLPPTSLAEQLNKILATVKEGFRVQ